MWPGIVQMRLGDAAVYGDHVCTIRGLGGMCAYWVLLKAYYRPRGTLALCWLSLGPVGCERQL